MQVVEILKGNDAKFLYLSVGQNIELRILELDRGKRDAPRNVIGVMLEKNAMMASTISVLNPKYLTVIF